MPDNFTLSNDNFTLSNDNFTLSNDNFTLSNARQFYWSKGDPSGLIGLNDKQHCTALFRAKFGAWQCNG